MEVQQLLVLEGVSSQVYLCYLCPLVRKAELRFEEIYEDPWRSNKLMVPNLRIHKHFFQ